MTHSHGHASVRKPLGCSESLTRAPPPARPSWYCKTALGADLTARSVSQPPATRWETRLSSSHLRCLILSCCRRSSSLVSCSSSRFSTDKRTCSSKQVAAPAGTHHHNRLGALMAERAQQANHCMTGQSCTVLQQLPLTRHPAILTATVSVCCCDPVTCNYSSELAVLLC